MSNPVSLFVSAAISATTKIFAKSMFICGERSRNWQWTITCVRISITHIQRFLWKHVTASTVGHGQVFCPDTLRRTSSANRQTVHGLSQTDHNLEEKKWSALLLDWRIFKIVFNVCLITSLEEMLTTVAADRDGSSWSGRPWDGWRWQKYQISLAGDRLWLGWGFTVGGQKI